MVLALGLDKAVVVTWIDQARPRHPETLEPRQVFARRLVANGTRDLGRLVGWVEELGGGEVGEHPGHGFAEGDGVTAMLSDWPAES